MVRVELQLGVHEFRVDHHRSGPIASRTYRTAHFGTRNESRRLFPGGGGGGGVGLVRVGRRRGQGGGGVVGGRWFIDRWVAGHSVGREERGTE